MTALSNTPRFATIGMFLYVRLTTGLTRAGRLRRLIGKKIVWIQDAEGLDPRHWCLLIPVRHLLDLKIR